jgi:predicted enzyme related to lactoylglutathione lyase
MILGLRTVQYNIPPDKMVEAKAWYTGAAGVPPYFDEPFYVGFAVGGFELGLLPDGGAPGPGGTIAYWGTSDIDEEVKRLLALGATLDTAPTDVGGDIKVAVVIDPFGNQVGVIQNPHFSTADVR